MKTLAFVLISEKEFLCRQNFIAPAGLQYLVGITLFSDNVPLVNHAANSEKGVPGRWLQPRNVDIHMKTIITAMNYPAFYPGRNWAVPVICCIG